MLLCTGKDTFIYSCVCMYICIYMDMSRDKGRDISIYIYTHIRTSLSLSLSGLALASFDPRLRTEVIRSLARSTRMTGIQS